MLKVNISILQELSIERENRINITQNSLRNNNR